MTNPPETPDAGNDVPRYPTQPPASGQPPYSQQPPYGQAPYSQPPYSQQPPYGQAPYSQPPYSQQPPYGQAPNSQPPYSQQPPYGQQPPYAPPGGMRQPVSIGEAFRYAWQAFKLTPAPWIVVTLVSFIVNSIGQTIVTNLRGTGGTSGLMFVYDTPASWFVNLIFAVIGLTITAAMIQAALLTADGKRIDFNDFVRIPNLGQALLAAGLFYVAVTFGLFLLLIPGIIIAILGVWYLEVVLDRKVGAFDALKGSATLVSQNLGTTLLFLLASFGVLILGLLALGVGLLVAVPLVSIAAVFVYRRISGGPVMVPGSAGS
ncbi:MAG TPA: hypothetical protein VFC82_05460 [Actinomycetaceae bacterium]|nr:hypothetical protein [Actinomycetaceae bacterium]